MDIEYETIRGLLQEASNRALHYIGDLANRSVAPSSEALEGLMKLNSPLPEHASDAIEVLRLLDAIGGPATMASAGPRFLGLWWEGHFR